MKRNDELAKCPMVSGMDFCGPVEGVVDLDPANRNDLESRIISMDVIEKLAIDDIKLANTASNKRSVGIF